MSKTDAQLEAEEIAANSVFRLAPDDDLPQKAKDYWWLVINSFKGERFLEAERGMLHQHCRTYAELLALEDQLKTIDDHFDTDRFGRKVISAPALRMDIVFRQFMASASSLRITPQSRLPAPTSSARNSRSGAMPGRPRRDWSGRRSSGCSPTSPPAKSMSSSSTRSTG